MSAPPKNFAVPTERAIGVCSWSLRPSSSADLVSKVCACGVRAVQIALNPCSGDPQALLEIAGALRDQGIEIRSAMMQTKGEDYRSLASIARTGGLRPDEHWLENLSLARTEATLAHSIQVNLVTLHAGFLPHERSDPERTKLIGRLRQIADVFADSGVRVGFETGQETAETLLDVLDEIDRATVGVNFDPANMILYGMGDPVDAFQKLGRRVFQVHVKDARAAKVRGEWGVEVPVGSGEIDWPLFFDALDHLAPKVDLMIEREAGDQRIEDVNTARELVETMGSRRALRA